MRRVSGLDVNGWRDIAARDWDIEEPDVQLEAARIVDGGLGAVAVKQNSGDWIGGPQALLAPHGRGQGWGEIGSQERRLSLAPMLDDLRSDNTLTVNEIYVATVNALARGTDEVILSVPDVPNFDEAAQFRTLSIFHRDRRQFRLLWRPVAAFLHALDCHAIPPNADGALFCFLIHSGTGIEVQTLRLRRDSEHSDHVAPERDGYGFRILRNLGLKQLTDRAHACVTEANPILAEASCERSALALKLMCGDRKAGDIEILRLNNGNWIEIIAPEIAESDIFSNTDFAKDLDFATSETITATFLLTPLAARFASILSRRLQAFFPNMTTLDWDATARGSLRAGRLIERGLPHYFDRLTPISLAVMKKDEPQFDDLIGSNATLPANREYVSPPYRDLKWIAGKHDIEFYVLKGDDEIRFWSVHLDEAPKSDVAVELRIRQTPGQSWAKLSLTSPEWEPLQRAPIFLDWTTLDPIDASPEEVLQNPLHAAISKWCCAEMGIEWRAPAEKTFHVIPPGTNTSAAVVSLKSPGRESVLRALYLLDDTQGLRWDADFEWLESLLNEPRHKVLRQRFDHLVESCLVDQTALTSFWPALFDEFLGPRSPVLLRLPLPRCEFLLGTEDRIKWDEARVRLVLDLARSAPLGELLVLKSLYGHPEPAAALWNGFEWPISGMTWWRAFFEAALFARRDYVIPWQNNRLGCFRLGTSILGGDDRQSRVIDLELFSIF
ncbi:hypothetical protein R3F77_00625 [Bradyrhizobium japonicum]|uniref:hypothetical protein n=1 Tax=Bradyrhizobium japonicum TaxID=375 RepID=UPI002B487B96|nr:hypothetical protein [Bradyrhizobium japonicum]WRJ92860.1 hypothetical protein R3F77_00625 [Bradyrhizobium japonicum]